ncbi:hypothetical protein ACJMK2_039621, partial [Sinanodonta woodiana]
FAWTREMVRPEGLKESKQSVREISSVEADIGQFLFQAMDMEIERNNIVTLTEYIAFWSRADSNNDKRVSTQEVKIFLEEHMIGSSSNAEQIFGETDITNSFSLKITFKLFDTN